ncbi:MAG: 4Fe-4S dicluster domain-containing protein [Methanobrevibacter sp.]|jgi:heterodisulfide reductase subunit C|nr:4Fe-4S dicluster domain-containing protein [Candidatus Methanovirga basalitermitum]
MSVQIENNPLKFARKILSDLRASEDMGLLKCVQCGMCTSTCPGAKNSDYNPRGMVEKVLEGEESIISDEEIWNCFYCYTCHSVCPVGNNPCEINQILRGIAIDKGIANDKVGSFAGYGDSFLTIGIGAMPKSFFMELNEDIEGWLDFKSKLEEIREELGLGSITISNESIEEINTLLKKVGFNKRIEELKK